MNEQPNQADQAELLLALRALVEQMAQPRVAPADELWTTDDIAAYLKLAADTTEPVSYTHLTLPTIYSV